MDFKAANDYITQRMLRDLPGKLYYHGMHHTLDVCRAVDEIAQGEKVHGDDLILLRTAAIYHDIGFVVEYNHNEELATEIAGHTLPSYHYAPEQIDIIKKIIQIKNRITRYLTRPMIGNVATSIDFKKLDPLSI